MGRPPKEPVRDWITTEEAAEILEVTPVRFRQFMNDTIRPSILPHSVLVTRTWLHYIRDVEKLKAARDNGYRIQRKKRQRNINLEALTDKK